MFKPYVFTIALLVFSFVGIGCQRSADPADKTSEEKGPPDRLDISLQAQQTIELEVGPVQKGRYIATIVVPGIVVEIPGRTRRYVPAPIGGVVDEIFCAEGELVNAGGPLFRLHLMHEELISDQGELLRLAQDLRVVDSNVRRYEKIAMDGVVAGKKLIEFRNEGKRILAQISALRQQLLLHGLNQQQIEQIEGSAKTDDKERVEGQLVHSVVVRAPVPEAADGPRAPVLIEKLPVRVGQHVEHGSPLCSLADLSNLYIKGQAFDADVPYLQDVIATGRTVRAVIGSGQDQKNSREDLQVERLDNSVDLKTRLHGFYVRLPNQLIATNDNQGRYVNWKFSPGQRVRLHVPVRVLEDRIVLPIDAVARDGLESYVFRQDGNYFQRLAVQIERRDARQQVVVLAPGQLFDGTVIAMNCADLLNLELKNDGSAPADGHHGHAH